jgi:CheY-like chemotaxis protein/GAF domain-containing protein
LSRSIAVEAAGEVATLKDNINEMIRNLKETTRINTEQDWLKTNLTRFTRMLQGQRDLLAVAKLILSELAPLVNAQHGIFYLNEAPEGSDADLKLLASYAHRERKQLNSRIKEGEGLVGQVAFEKERILLTEVPPDYIKVGSGLGEASPRNIIVLPVLFENQVKAVVELASFGRFSETHLSFLDQLVESVGIVLNTLAASSRTEELLKQSQSLTQELQNQQRELQETNQRLEQQARSLTESERLLKEQQEELQQTNEELEEKARLLSEQNREVEQKNSQIELARRELEEKAEQLALTSKYKSEFLANMSHELRTPLNSLLILSKMLTENAEGNLSAKQVEYASTIHLAGVDLLTLINEILDLAKIESGKMEVEVRRVRLDEVRDQVERSFRPMAESKGLAFGVEVDPSLPDAVHTDGQRLQQVLRNLLVNAIKFTDAGSVGLKVVPAAGGWRRGNEALDKAEQVLAFRVTDTGIGIPPDKHRIIFEAFQQLDGTSTRKYGGTGLGLSISREIAGLLQGEITVESEPGKGSTFTFYLPLRYPGDGGRPAGGSGTGGLGTPGAWPTPRRTVRRQPVGGPGTTATEDEPDLSLPAEIADDREELGENDRVVLIIEDDVPFARILLDQAREKGFKGVVALQGEAGIRLARDVQPDAITLDLELPLMDGWAVLDRLKHDPVTRHIPVHIISARGERQRGLRQGALAYLEKPVTKDALDDAFAGITAFLERRVKRLLVVEDDDAQRQSVTELVGDRDIETVEARTGAEALAAVRSQSFDCCVLDLGLPDMTGFELIEAIRRELGPDELPIVVYTGRELTKAEESQLRPLADAVIVKDVKSPERLLDETALFLHRVQSELPPEKRQMLEQVHLSDPVLAEKTVLIVDDDMRNVFALTSVLERHRMKVIYAESGREGIEKLQATPGVDVVLMDVMLPEMDGYETMRAIRADGRFRNLPIIALTAKAMKGDREKCIEAGASDYVAKPVDTEQLLSLLRVWLYK